MPDNGRRDFLAYRIPDVPPDFGVHEVRLHAPEF
jgi:hypothetical protein